MELSKIAINAARLLEQTSKMDGFELCRQMKKIDGKVKVSFITGFDIRRDDLKVDSTIFNNINNNKHIIQKPISIDDLVKQVKAELA